MSCHVRLHNTIQYHTILECKHHPESTHKAVPAKEEKTRRENKNIQSDQKGQKKGQQESWETRQKESHSIANSNASSNSVSVSDNNDAHRIAIGTTHAGTYSSHHGRHPFSFVESLYTSYLFPNHLFSIGFVGPNIFPHIFTHHGLSDVFTHHRFSNIFTHYRFSVDYSTVLINSNSNINHPNRA